MKKKLTLKKETLRVLGTCELNQVVRGFGSVSVNCPVPEPVDPPIYNLTNIRGLNLYRPEPQTLNAN